MTYRFPRGVVSLQVKEDVAVGYVVGKVTATDDDSGENARISYSFEGNSDSFDIDSDSGNWNKKKITKLYFHDAWFLTVRTHWLEVKIFFFLNA